MERLVLFAKAPRHGNVKTRLVPPLTTDQALALHEAMLFDQVAFLHTMVRSGRTAELCLDQPWPEAKRTAADGPLARTLQGAGDLGHRMERALARGHASGATRIALVGGDAPTLPAAIVEEAFEKLRAGADAVVTPAPDGGYVLVATAGPLPALFRNIAWGTDGVLTTTRQRAGDAGLRLDETAPWGDVDRLSDLPRLLDEAARDPERAPLSAAVAASLQLYFAQEPMV